MESQEIKLKQSSSQRWPASRSSRYFWPFYSECFDSFPRLNMLLLQTVYDSADSQFLSWILSSLLRKNNYRAEHAMNNLRRPDLELVDHSPLLSRDSKWPFLVCRSMFVVILIFFKLCSCWIFWRCQNNRPYVRVWNTDVVREPQPWFCVRKRLLGIQSGHVCRMNLGQILWDGSGRSSVPRFFRGISE